MPETTPEREPDHKPAPKGAENLKFTERLAWLGFMLFFVVVLAIYVGRGLALEREVTAANMELLEAQMRLAEYTRHEVPRPVQIGLTNNQMRDLQRRGLNRPEDNLRQSLMQQPELIPHEPVLGGSMYFVPDGIFILNDRWVLANFEDGHLRGQTLLEYDVINAQPAWDVIDSYVQ